MDILIVEDELEIARLIQLSLEKEGFSCHRCHDGVQALRVFQEHLMLTGYKFEDPAV